jgi:hypothetical protein
MSLQEKAQRLSQLLKFKDIVKDVKANLVKVNPNKYVIKIPTPLPIEPDWLDSYTGVRFSKVLDYYDIFDEIEFHPIPYISGPACDYLITEQDDPIFTMEDDYICVS